eukprot:357846-Chlamydomonas_euryale.AAC.1
MDQTGSARSYPGVFRDAAIGLLVVLPSPTVLWAMEENLSHEHIAMWWVKLPSVAPALARSVSQQQQKDGI